MTGQLTGTLHLVRLILRRDRIRLPLWLLGFAALTGASATAVQSLYDTPEKIAGYGVTVSGSAAGRFINGRPYDVDNLGGITAYELSMTAAVIVTLMVMFLVVRHTRAEEETGRAELLRGGVLGRHAHTASAVLVAVVAALLLGVVDAALLAATGLDGSGSVLHGASVAALGIAFTAISAAAAQVTSSARMALGIAGGVLGLLFVVRGAGDVEETFLTWLSPFGWAQAVRPYGDPQWWPVLALLALAVVVFGTTGYLTAHRDEGAGLLQPRAGRPRARASLGTPLGLAMRLQRGLFLGWTSGLVLTAVLFGSFGGEVESMVETNEEIGEIFAAQGTDVLEGYFAYVLAFLAVVTSAYTLASALRLRGEEASGRAEVLLSTRTSRLSWALGGLAVTVLTTLLVLVLIGLSVGLAHAAVTGDTGPVGTLVAAMLAQAPAVFVVAAAGVALHGLVPRWAMLAWVVFGFAMLQSYLGGLLQLPDAVSALSPFWHLAQIPVDDFDAVPALVLSALALLLTGLGLWQLRRRDVLTG